MLSDREGDIVSFVATARNAQLFFKRISIATRSVSSAMIIGGGRTSYYLAKMLLDEGIEVKIIEENKERCSYLACNECGIL